MEQTTEMNPYVTKVKRLAESLNQLSKGFRTKSVEENSLEESVISDILGSVKIYACTNCDNAETCRMNEANKRRYITELIKSIEEYGLELKVSTKRELEQRCRNFANIRKIVEHEMGLMRKYQLWNERIHRNKEASMVAIQAFAEAVEEVTKEIGESLFRDERLEKRVIKALKKEGVKTTELMIYISIEGIFQVHLCVKAKKGISVQVNDVAYIVSKILSKKFIPEVDERYVLSDRFEEVVLIEKPKFQVLCGCAQMEKEGSAVSGDNFSITNIGRGQKMILLSDGMGSGDKAFEESQKAIELTKELLEAGVPTQKALEMVNAAMASEEGELAFSTLDMCLIDLYRGTITLMKAGAAPTYIHTKYGDKKYTTSSLPLGIVTRIDVDSYKRIVEDGDYIVMVTDGVTEIDTPARQENEIREVFANKKTKNPDVLAEQILDVVLKGQGGMAKDDMMVIVIGIWAIGSK